MTILLKIISCLVEIFLFALLITLLDLIVERIEESIENHKKSRDPARELILYLRYGIGMSRYGRDYWLKRIELFHMMREEDD